MKVLVTGAAGFIGSHLCRVLKQKHRVIALVRDWVPYRWTFDALSGCVMVRGDIRDLPLLNRVIGQYSTEWVFHLASQAIVRQAALNPVETFDSNVMGTVNILEASRQQDVEKLSIQSTDKVFGNTLEATEDSPLKAIEPYSASKVAVDIIAQAYRQTYGMRIVIPRSCNVYGLDYANRIIPNTVRSCLRGQNPVIYEGEKDTARQYIYIDDEVVTLLNLMERDVDGVFNIPGTFKTQEEVVLEVLKHFPSLKPRYEPRVGLKEISRQSMAGSLGSWATPFEKGIKLTIERFKEYTEDWSY